MNSYRPWGEIKWLLSRLNAKKYSFYGCISTEDRSLAIFRHLHSIDFLASHKFLEIIDPIDTEEHQGNRNSLFGEYDELVHERSVSRYNLLCPIGEVNSDIHEFVSTSDGEIIVDISSFPKRFFFPIVKMLLKHEKIRTLIITYSTPKSYCSNDLSESPMDWSHIPMFDSDDPDINYKMALIGLGFMPLGLSSLFNDKFSELELRLMFPFPPGAPLFQRTWKFLEEMRITPKVDFKKIMRIDALNVSDTFDMIRSLSDKKGILMAPYEPKTMSLAMCLYACSTDSPVYYTQPRAYDPKYSTGTSESYGYCIKLNGESLYKL